MREKFARDFIDDKIAVDGKFRFFLGLLEGSGSTLEGGNNGLTTLLKVDEVVCLLLDHMQACRLMAISIIVSQG